MEINTVEVGPAKINKNFAERIRKLQQLAFNPSPMGADDYLENNFTAKEIEDIRIKDPSLIGALSEISAHKLGVPFKA